MIKARTYCDCCGEEFTSTYWDCAPSRVEIKMSAPAQNYESRVLEHVCSRCRRAINARISELIQMSDQPAAERLIAQPNDTQGSATGFAQRKEQS